MRIYKLIITVLCVWCICAPVSVLAQKPVIDTRSQPIILKLDPMGNHNVTLNELATVTKSTDSPLIVKYLPRDFNCSTSGPQSVKLTALTNGSRGISTPANIRFDNVNGVCFDRAGNLYTTEASSNLIRKITPEGVVTIFAGTGVSGHDDGPGNKATFGINRGGLIRDSVDNLYLADTNNGLIRKISPDGVVSTFKKGFRLPISIAFDKYENLYVADEGAHGIFKVAPDGRTVNLAGNGEIGDTDGSGREVSFQPFQGMAVDAQGNVFIGVSENIAAVDPVKIKKITPQGVVSTFYDPGKIGNGADPVKGFNAAPYSLKFDAAGNLYIGDAGMLKILRPDGSISIIAGDVEDGSVNGQGRSARFGVINSFDFDPCGNIMVADWSYSNIRKITRAGVVTTYAGGGSDNLTGNIGPSSCLGATELIDVVVQSTPVFTTAFPDLTLLDCANLANYTLKATVTDNCPDSHIRITQTPEPYSPIENNVPVNVTLTATDKTGGTASVSFIVTARYSGAPPGRSVQVTASQDHICVGQEVTFTANVVDEKPGTTYQWLVNEEPVGTDAATFTTADLKNGDVVNCAATTANGCGIPNTGLPVTMSVNEIPTVTINTPGEILSGGSASLNSVVTGDIASYAWSPVDGLSDPTSKYTRASPDNTTTYHLTVTSTAGCEASADVTVSVVSVVTPPNAFTPNGDGVNDLWNIAHIEDYPDCIINIYNRNGGVVFQSKGYPKAWNGTVNGRPVPGGVYYYTLDLKDGSEIRRGSLTIIR